MITQTAEVLALMARGFPLRVWATRVEIDGREVAREIYVYLRRQVWIEQAYEGGGETEYRLTEAGKAAFEGSAA